MSGKLISVVTGAFGFTGRFIASQLIAENLLVVNMTNHPERQDPFNGKVKCIPFNFDRPAQMVENFKSVDTVYNTYWVRFNRVRTTFGQAVANVQNMIRAAAEAGVRRFVHISISNPDEHSTSDYFKGKAIMERTLAESGLSYAIIRPTVLFGDNGILFNNIAWLLRRFPVLGVPGNGEYRLQPVYAPDVAELAIKCARLDRNITVDAAGPETFTYKELVYMLRSAVRSRCIIMHSTKMMSYLASLPINRIVGDVLITREEIDKLMLDKLCVTGPPLCKTRFSAWVEDNAHVLGTKYFSEVKMHFL